VKTSVNSVVKKTNHRKHKEGTENHKEEK
jgi:hypothetical protein